MRVSREIGPVVRAIVALSLSVAAGAGGCAAGDTAAPVDASPPTLISVVVTPAIASVMVGEMQQFSAVGHFSDGSTTDVTTTALWRSSGTAIATISTDALATGVAAGTTTITAQRGTVTGTATITVIAKQTTLLSIAVTPANPSVGVGTTQQFSATGTFDDGSTTDLSGTAVWSSSATSTATINATGLASALASGTTTIAATSGAVKGSTTMTVTAPMLISIAVTPDKPAIATGTKQAFTATGTFKDPTTNAITTQDLTAMVTWSSGTPAAATITAGGLASAVAVGTTVISATSGAVVGTTTLTVKMADLVSIAVTTATPSVAKGTSATFIATGTFADQTTQNLSGQVIWSSSVPATAIISNAGLATSVAMGTTVIGAKLGTVMGMLTLTVTDAALVSIAVSAELPVPSATPRIAKNTKLQLDAIGTYTDGSKQDLGDSVTWASSSAAVTVSNAAGSKGLATAGNAAGTSMLSATTGTGAAAVTGKLTVTVTNDTLVSLVVTPAAPAIAAGTSLQFLATGFFTDASRQDLTETVTWSSATVAAATISNVAGHKGLARGVAVGAAIISASVGNANPVTATATLTVSTALLQSIAIEPATPSVALGTTVTLSATGTYSDGSKQDLTSSVTWSSATAGVATISNAAGSNGKVTPVAKGTSVITAALVAGNQTIAGSATLAVSDSLLKSIAVTTPGTTTIQKGTALQLTATGVFTDGRTVDITKMVTWSSDAPGAATVSNAATSIGLVTAVSAGPAVISATSSAPSENGQPVVGNIALTVDNGKLVSISVTPATPAIAAGTKLQFVATGTFDDGAKQDITASVTWSSSVATTATIDSAGLAAAVAAGTAAITAAQAAGAGAISGSTTLTVTRARLVSVIVQAHPAASIANGTSVSFTATGFFDDATAQDLTDTATWASSMTAVATISNDPATNGQATGRAVGTTNITASVVIDATTVTSPPVALTVTPATLVSVAVTPALASVAKGGTLNLVATGTFTDGSTQVLTNAVTWASAAPGTATVSNAAGQHGRVQGVTAGKADVTATSNAASGSKVGRVTVTVTN